MKTLSTIKITTTFIKNILNFYVLGRKIHNMNNIYKNIDNSNNESNEKKPKKSPRNTCIRQMILAKETNKETRERK